MSVVGLADRFDVVSPSVDCPNVLPGASTQRPVTGRSWSLSGYPGGKDNSPRRDGEPKKGYICSNGAMMFNIATAIRKSLTEPPKRSCSPNSRDGLSPPLGNGSISVARMVLGMARNRHGRHHPE